MKKVLLLGDSIRQNYQEYVKEKLVDYAKVYYPNDNGRFCQFTLRYVHDWIRILSDGKNDFDVIHFNCGLWDVLRLSNEEQTFTSEEEYGELLKRIYNRLKYLCPNAKIIFALTTKVIEPGFEPGEQVAIRKNTDIQRFNEVAKKIFDELNVEINDLYSISEELPLEAHSDQVHFDTDQGRRRLADGVVRCLEKHLVCLEN